MNTKPNRLLKYKMIFNYTAVTFICTFLSLSASATGGLDSGGGSRLRSTPKQVRDELQTLKTQAIQFLVEGYLPKGGILENDKISGLLGRMSRACSQFG